jgi:uncharacterized membrane protein
MESAFRQVAAAVALGVEAGAVLLIAIGAIEALASTTWRLASTAAPGGAHTVIRRKEIWIRFAGWLLLGLEFELAADIIRSAIAPSWTQIGQLAAIAVIRTGLNYFLEQDIDEYVKKASRDAVTG